MHAFFRTFAQTTAAAMGSPWAFLLATAVIVGWAVTGPLFGFSDTWQLVINTGTTIVTFLMVFLIQNTQNRDAKALHLKLDELLRAVAVEMRIEQARGRRIARLGRLRRLLRDGRRSRALAVLYPDGEFPSPGHARQNRHVD